MQKQRRRNLRLRVYKYGIIYIDKKQNMIAKEENKLKGIKAEMKGYQDKMKGIDKDIELVGENRRNQLIILFEFDII